MINTVKDTCPLIEDLGGLWKGRIITGDDDMTYDISFLRTDKNEWVSCCGTYPFEDVIAWRKIKPYYEP